MSSIVLVRPFLNTDSGVFEPLSLLYLSSYLKSKEIDVAVIDNPIDKALYNSTAGKKYVNQLVDRIIALKKAFVGISLYSSEVNEIRLLVEKIKVRQASIKIVLGGPHPSALPEETLRLIPGCDYVVRGEGEIVLYNLLKSITTNAPLEEVKGISFSDARGNIFTTDEPDVIEDINLLPFPDRNSVMSFYKDNTYSSFLFGSPVCNVMSSRGCAFHCTFCFKVCNKYRPRSPQNVLDEIDWIMSTISPQTIQIMDDSFTTQRKRCVEILDGLIERGYSCKFRVRSRVDAVNQELLNKMKQAGVDTIVFGFESGSQKMLDNYNKRTTIKQNIKACEMALKAGINSFGDIILFYPGETEETLKMTKKFIKNANPTLLKFHVLTPLPNTQVYHDAKRNGTLVGDWDGGIDTPWIRLEEFDNLEKMEKIRIKLNLLMLLSPKRIFWLFKAFGGSIVRNPWLSLRLVCCNILRDGKY